jgi:hypothetical protein
VLAIGQMMPTGVMRFTVVQTLFIFDIRKRIQNDKGSELKNFRAFFVLCYLKLLFMRQ